MTETPAIATIPDNEVPAKMTQYRWFVLALLFLIVTVAHADRANIGFALPYIRKEFAMSNTEAGALISLFFIGYAVLQVPSGFLVKKYGVRIMLTMGMIFTSLITSFLGLCNSVLTLKAFRLGVGVSEAPVAIGLTAAINNWFPSKEKGTASGIFLAGSKLGPLIVPPICGWIILTWGWREIFFSFGFVGLITAIVWYLMVSNKPADSKFASKAEAEYIASGESANTSQSIRKKREYKLWWVDKIVRAKNVESLKTTAQVFKSWDIYGAAFGYFFMVGLVSILMSWLPTYLINVKKFAIMKSAFLSAAPFAGAVIGNFIGGWVSDNLLNKRRKPMMMITALSTTVMMYSLISAPADPNLLALLLFTTGVLLALGYSAFMVYPMGRTNKETYPLAMSIVNTGGQLGGAGAPLFVGMILDKFSWDAVFLSLSIGSLICMIVVCTIIEPVEDPLVLP